MKNSSIAQRSKAYKTNYNLWFFSVALFFTKIFNIVLLVFLNYSERLFELSWNNTFKRKDGFRNNLKCLSKPSSDNVEIKIDFVLFNVKRIHRKKKNVS